jgi:hypothetical protein
MMKKSIALLFTLIFITVILAIVGSIVAIYNSISQNNFEKSISQNNMLIIDIKSALDNIVNDVNSSNLNMLFNTFPISNKDGSFRELIQIKPLLDKINLNEYKNSKKKKYIDFFLDNVLNFYNVKEPLFFKALILDTLDNDVKERAANSEMKLKYPFFKNGRIYNFKHFQEILDYYVKMTDDKNIYNIPWKDLIFFSKEDTIIDCNLINEKVAKFLGLIYKGELNCKSLNRKENFDIIKSLDIISFKKANSYLVDINISYSFTNINMVYDLKRERMKNIRSNSLY